MNNHDIEQISSELLFGSGRANMNCETKDEVFVGNIKNLTLENDAYRKVLFTTITQQLVLMCLLPQEDIGNETHITTTQFIRIESGTGKCVLNGVEYPLKDDSVIVIPPGTHHNIINTSSDTKMKLYTIYSPPEHNTTTVQLKKTDPSPQKGGYISKRNNFGICEVYRSIKKDYQTLCNRL